MAPVAVGERGWKAIDRNPAKSHGFYTNLAIWRVYAQKWDWHPFPVTMAVNNVIALRTSLDQLLEEGIENRLERYRQLAHYLRSEIRRIGLQPFTSDAEMSPVLTAVLAPENLSVDHMMQYLEGE